MAAYVRFDDLLACLPAAQQAGCRRLLADHHERILAAPGSARSHQNWPGGLADHITDMANIAVALYDSLAATGRPLGFSVGDVLLIVFLHDIEKAFRYVSPAHPLAAGGKADRSRFRQRLLADYDIRLDDRQANALRYAEGENDDYRPGERVMGPLAAFVHACDVLSARLWPQYPAPGIDAWSPPRASNLPGGGGQSA